MIVNSSVQIALLQLRQLPQSLTKLSILTAIEDTIPILPGYLPISLSQLHFEHNVNLSTPGSLPRSLTSLTFGRNDQGPPDSSINPLPYITHLKLGSRFQDYILPGSLPRTLTSLTLGEDYNMECIKGALPSSLLSLEFGNSFNKRLPIGWLPSSLTSLKFGSEFNKPLPSGTIPPLVRDLRLGEMFVQRIRTVNFPNILNLHLTSFNQLHYIDRCPDLRSLSFSCTYYFDLHPFYRQLESYTFSYIRDPVSNRIGLTTALKAIESAPFVQTYIIKLKEWTIQCRKLDMHLAMCIVEDHNRAPYIITIHIQ
ncbi:hypothetical protein SAMD00019534_018670 [Acytostelium subglobosum LB1]|uniref:hypothetical protein n=1 Tax=Acytostelium subglobosum LB1 TaxID=1410327 RepID=UPI000645156D|nr:hypothetical protein SAMD00019534_018670 [Acytostelium subglobosum LB1]GAM18692.1 hypothetical protein SAMD00019534_018670 [Acytostelium subglobosum LB1]|eukprot:XP_012757912.1 hypothetical protein SAMD00019534_018670 [Acytostelium subglobosum LB1]